MATKPKVLLWGPLPGSGQVFGGGIGGYARCNGQLLRSSLREQFALQGLAMTVPRFANRLAATLDLPFRLLRDLARLSWALWRQRPQVLHITALYWRSIYREAWAVFIAKRLKVAVLYDIRAGTFSAFCQRARWFERPLLHYIMRRADAIAAEGERDIPLIQARFGRQARWVPNFFLFDRPYPTAPLRQPAADAPLKLAFVGYLLPEKGVDVLLEVGWRLSQRRPIELTLIGAPAPAIAPILQRYLARQSERFRLILTGRLELAPLLAQLTEQHLFVFLSRFFGEGHANAVTEALACGLPVIASRHGFLAEVVTPDAGLILDDPQDVAAATEVIWALSQDWPRLQALGAGARARVEAAFSDQVVLPKLAALYGELAGA